MNRIATACGTAALAFALLAPRPVSAQDMQEKVAAAKEAAARNQEALRHYSWIEKTELSLKGEVKNTKIEACQYGPDGKVQKTPLSEPPAQEESGGRRRRGGRLKAKVVEKKKAEMQEEMKAAVALVKQYLPPSPEKIQAAMAAGTITIVPGQGTTALTIADYVKPGDSLVLTLDSANKAMTKIDVSTYLEKPDDTVTLGIGMQALPDGTSYAGDILLSIPSDEIDVKITNSNYQKLAQ